MNYMLSISATRRLLFGLLLLSCILITFGSTCALAATETPTISATVNREAIEWQVDPENSYERLVLVVIGPEKTAFRMIYEADDIPFLGLNSLTSSGLVDGFYKYELRLIPSLTPEAQEFVSLIRNGDNNDLLTEAQNAGLLPTEGVVLAGSFTVNQGVFLLPETSETFLRADQVIADDLIIQLSACIGSDCINGEAFGFDTLRLKENNLRMHFDDTSTSSTFPANDWRIIINSSENGGGNYFAIEDATAGKSVFTVEAGARTNSLYVESDGDIGIGTANPAVDLHIVTGNTPTSRLEQDGTSGFTPQTWDIAGNEANFFVRDVTNGSALPFRIFPDAPSDVLCIDDNGYVGLGKETTPQARLHIFDTSGEAEPSNGNGNLQVDSNATIEGNALINGELQLASSREIKTEIHELGVTEAKDAFKQLTPVSFHYKNNQERRQVGFIAEDVPEMFASRSRKSVNPMDIVAVLTKIVQEQQAVIGNQNKVLEKMDRRLKSLEYEISENSHQDW